MNESFDRMAINSTLLTSIAYAANEGILEAEFRDGDVYRFFLVPAKIWGELQRSESKGAFFNASIRDTYPHVRVRRDESDHLLADLERSIEALKSKGPADP